MIAYYPTIKSLHVHFVLISVSVFALRGLLVLAGSKLAHHRVLKYGSYLIDTGLLLFALLLLAVLHLNPIAQPWLALKLCLLVLYIVLGSFALKRAKTTRGKLFAYLMALLVVAAMYGIALAHHPLGWARLWGWG